MNKPFWETTYRDRSISTFGEASAEIRQIAQTLPKTARILDAGCGEGRNALYLAQLGFAVDAFDISESGIAKLKNIAEENAWRIDAWCGAIEDFEFAEDYDFIISHGVLHLLEREEWSKFLAKMKAHTRPDGINVVVVFTDALPIPEDLKDFCVGLFKDGEIQDEYSGWHIDFFKSFTFRDSHPGGLEHLHAANKLIARKPGRDAPNTAAFGPFRT